MTLRAPVSLHLRLAAFALALIALIAIVGEGAYAAFTSQQLAKQTVSSALLQPVPGAPAASLGTCVRRTSHQVRLSWAQTPSAFADGYDILRRTGTGAFVSVGTVAGRTTTTFTDQFGDTGWDTTYTYTVRATRNLWRSADSPTVSITTERRFRCN